MQIIRYPEGHPARVAAEEAHAAWVASRLAFYAANRAGLARAAEYMHRVGEERRPAGSLWPASVDVDEAIVAAGLPLTEEARHLVRERDEAARPVTIRY